MRLRFRRDPDDAAELVQGFFARAFEKGRFKGFDPARARFRTYLKGSLDLYTAEVARAEGRLKRGGGQLRVDLPFDGAEQDLVASGALDSPASAASAEAIFDREWTRSLFASALERLHARCVAEGKAKYFDTFRRYAIEPELSAREGASRPARRSCSASASPRGSRLSTPPASSTGTRGRPFIVMEHLRGKDLARHLAEHGPFSVESAVDHVIEACAAIAEAHALGIVHRDLVSSRPAFAHTASPTPTQNPVPSAKKTEIDLRDPALEQR